MTASSLALTAQGLACERGGRQVFRDLAFRVEGGEALVVTGPNGAGKSSLLRMIAGLIRPAAGTLTLHGGPEDTPLALLCHYFGHQDALKPALTVAETVAFWRDFLGGDASGAPDVAAALAAVDLDHLADLPAGWLSAGQRRRLAFSRLIATRRPIWLLDEPTAALDSASEARLIGHVATHLARGGLAVIATHLPLDLPGVRSLRIAGGRAAA